MIWLNVEDSYYYDNISGLIDFLDTKYPKIAKKLSSDVNYEFVFFKKDIEKIIDKKEFDKIIISPYLPKDIMGMQTSFFGIITVENRCGILTTDEMTAKVEAHTKLNNKLGLIVEKSNLTLADMGVNKDIQNIVEQLEVKYAFGETPKAVFLAGIMGTGKSFFAQCLAGETKRLLVSFNLAKIMNFDNPIEAFDDMISYLVELKGKYLLWIDEIEKMFNGSESSEHIKNKFLTFLNDIGVTIDMDAFIVITANDVSDILKKNPEMVRSGRVEPYAKVFLDFLSDETAVKMMKLYLTKRNKLENQKLYIAHSLISFYNNNLPNRVFLYHIYKDNEEKIVEALKNIIEKEDNEEKIVQTIAKIEELFNGEQLNGIINNLTIDLEAEEIVDYIDRIYLEAYRDSSLKSFPYVPAEIKEIVSQLFYKNLETKINKDNKRKIINNIIKANMAIGDSGKEGVNKMLGNKDKFSIVIN